MQLLDSYIDKEENEKNFQKALEENDVDKMWECVFITCNNIAKSIYASRGFVAQEDDLYDVAMESTMMVMRDITDKGRKPKKLSAYCYLRVLCHVNGYGQDKLSLKLKQELSNINTVKELLR